MLGGSKTEHGGIDQWLSTEPTDYVEPPERPPLARLNKQGKASNSYGGPEASVGDS